MRAGELRQRIVIQEKIVAQDSFGAEIESWEMWATVWAQVETISGDEYIAQQAAGAMLTHKVMIRDRAGVLPTMQIMWGDRTLLIHAVLPDNVHREMVLMCSEPAPVPSDVFIVGESLIGGRDVIA